MRPTFTMGAIHSATTYVKNASAVKDDIRGAWARFVNHDELGAGHLSEEPANSDIDADDDGKFNPIRRVVVDLSAAMSHTLGKQVPQCANFRLKGLHIGIRPADDAYDNADDQGLTVGGRVRWLEPNLHLIDAIQAARKVDTLSEMASIDSDSHVFGTNRENYKNFRFGWRTEYDVMFPTAENFGVGTDAEGGTSSWCLYDYDGCLGIVSEYTDFKQLTDSDKDGALWTNRAGMMAGSIWTCAWTDRTNAIEGADVDYHMTVPAGGHYPICTGLVVIDIIYTSIASQLLIDNDYEVVIGVDVEGWEAF